MRCLRAAIQLPMRVSEASATWHILRPQSGPWPVLSSPRTALDGYGLQACSKTSFGSLPTLIHFLFVGGFSLVFFLISQFCYSFDFWWRKTVELLIPLLSVLNIPSSEIFPLLMRHYVSLPASSHLRNAFDRFRGVDFQRRNACAFVSPRRLNEIRLLLYLSRLLCAFQIHCSKKIGVILLSLIWGSRTQSCKFSNCSCMFFGKLHNSRYGPLWTQFPTNVLPFTIASNALIEWHDSHSI